MSSRLNALRCTIVSSTELPDRLLASGSFQHSPGSQPAVLLSYVFEVTKPWFENASLLPAIIDTLNSEYLLLNGDMALGVQFENLLKRVNQTLNDVSETGETDWIGNLNGMIACAFDDQLHFSQTGRCPAYLLQRNRIRQITDDGDVDHEKHPLKTFYNLSSGTLQPDDQLIIANSELYRQISLDALRRMLANVAPYESCQQIVKELKQQRNGNVTATVLQIYSGETERIQDPQSILMDEILEHRVRKIRRKLTPVVITAYNHGQQAATAIGTLTRDHVIPFTKQTVTAGIAVGKRIQEKRKKVTTIEVISPRKTRVYAGFPKKTVSKKRLFALVGASLLIVATSGSILTKIRHSSIQSNSDLNTQAITNAQDAISKIAVDIEQQQLEVAATEAGRAENLLSTLPNTQSGASTKLWQKLAAEEDILSKTSRIQSAQTITLPQSQTGLLYVKPFIYTFAANSSVLFRINETNPNQITQIPLPDNSDTVSALTTANNSSVTGFLLTTHGHIYQIIQTSLKVMLPVSGNFAPGTSLSSYNGNLYILDGSNGIVWRYVNAGTTYAAGTKYISTTPGSSSLTIDGSIYFLQGDGALAKYVSGKLDSSFTLHGVPVIAGQTAKPTQVLSDSTSSTLWVFAAAQTRNVHSTAKLLNFSKDGTFVSAYGFSTQDAQASQVAIDQTTKTLWLLCGNKLQRFSL